MRIRDFSMVAIFLLHRRSPSDWAIPGSVVRWILLHCRRGGPCALTVVHIAAKELNYLGRFTEPALKQFLEDPGKPPMRRPGESSRATSGNVNTTDHFDQARCLAFGIRFVIRLAGHHVGLAPLELADGQLSSAAARGFMPWLEQH